MTDKIRKDLEKAGFVELCADIDLAYGGTFYREDYPNEFTVIQITDLDSATGADGQIMVETLYTSFDLLDSGNMRSVTDCSGVTEWLKSKEWDREAKRAILLEAMIGYGLYDLAQDYAHGQLGVARYVAILDREMYKWNNPRDRWDVNVKGWGMTAFRRAVNMAIDAS